MRVMPKRVTEKVVWGVTHVGPWTEHAEAIGATPAEVEAFREKVEAAEAAMMRAEEARRAAKGATAALHEAVEAMGVAAAAIVLKVRAAATSNPNVYELAAIPTPAAASPLAPPGTPTGFAVELGADGAIGLTWKCKNPRGSTGVMYDVWRRIEPSGAYAYLGSTGKKRYRDATIPAGAVSLVYKVRAKRSTAAGPSATFNVTFGAVHGKTAVAMQTRESRMGGSLAA